MGFQAILLACLLPGLFLPDTICAQELVGELMTDDLGGLLSDSTGLPTYGDLPATPAPVVSPSDVPDSLPETVDLGANEFWRTPKKRRLQNYVQADFLLWWAGDSQLPALITTNPAGTVIGDVGISSSTRTLYGNETVGDWPNAGLRLRLGRFIRNSRISRVELDLWHLIQGSDTFAVSSSGGNPILSRPFFNSQTGAADAQQISFPGSSDGSFGSEYTRQAFGLDPSVFFCLNSSSCRWFELSTGYRFLWLQDQLKLNERVLLEPGGLIAPGSGHDVQDKFTANNRFHLWTIGLSHSENRGKWLVNVRGNIGLGVVTNEVKIRGSTRSFIGGTTTRIDDAGFLALQTNRGTHRKSQFAYVPELKGTLKRRLGKHTTAHLGYTMLWLPDVVQAVDHVPTVIDPRNLPVEQPGAGPDPKFEFVTSSLVMHGLNFGLRYDY